MTALVLAFSLRIRLVFNALPRLCALFLLLALLPESALAHLPAMFGRDFVRYVPSQEAKPALADVRQEGTEGDSGDELMADADPELDSESEAPSNEPDASPFKNKIAEVESGDGPYADGLVEPLSSLGKYYQSIGENDEAINVYRRALHVARVNDGLVDTRQLPVLRQMMELYRTTDDRFALDASYEYFFRLQRLGAPPYTQAKMDAIFEYLSWQREAYTTRLDGTARNRLLQTYEVNERILTSLIEAPEFNLTWYRQLVSSQIHHLYLLLGDEPIEDQLEPILSGANHGGLISSEDMVRRRIEYIQRAGVTLGSRLLMEQIDRCEAMDPKLRAGMWIELGDWYQWNSELKRANESYRSAIALLRESEHNDLIERWLGEPVELPDETAVWLQRRDKTVPDRAVVALRFDISARGNVSNTEVMEVPEEASAESLRIRRMLRDTHFRPRIVSGEPEATIGVERRYKLID
ncbi:MAG: tetratricopeptide repeat protein [Halioglobus sp.]